MDIRELIEEGSKKAGEQKALASLLHVHSNDLSNIKAGRRGLPAPACFLLAQYLGIDPARVIAASELVTEKNEERRKVFYPFVMGRAAMIAALAITALPSESQAQCGSLTVTDNANWHYVKSRYTRFLSMLKKCLTLPAFSYAT